MCSKLLLTVAASALLLLLPTACGDEPRRTQATPFSGQQLDRIEASLQARRTPGAEDPGADVEPLWFSNELLDEGTRLVVHVRLPLQVTVEDLATQEARCARVRGYIEDLLLPGQRVEMYLVFDTSIHACRDAETS